MSAITRQRGGWLKDTVQPVPASEAEAGTAARVYRLPAHRFEQRKQAPKRPTVTFDYDETITKAPKHMAYLAGALKDAGSRIVVVTGNQSDRKDLEAELDDYGFPYDRLVQYEDDETDGLRRAAILEKLGAWIGVDDRAGRAATYAKVCPHLFLSAEPSAEAQDKAVGAKKAAKKAVKASRSAAPAPPGYRSAGGADERCGTCLMFDQGRCWGYGNVAVEADHVCDSWTADEPSEAA